MAIDEELRQLQERQRERERASVPQSPSPSEFLDAMSQSEMKNVILDLFDQLRELNTKVNDKDKQLEEKDRMISSLHAKLDTVLENQKQQRLDIDSWLKKEKDWTKKEERLNQIISNLKDTIKLLKKHRYDKTSQKSGKKSDDKDSSAGNGGSSPESDTDLTEKKDDFDGSDSDGSIAAAADKDVKDSSADDSTKNDKEKESRPYRQGLTHNKMSADTSESHSSCKANMPEGAKFIRFGTGYAYEQITTIIRHEYQTVLFKLNGKIYEAYLPEDGEPEYIDRVPGTKASANFMAYLVYDRYHLHTPLYREVQRLLDEGMGCRYAGRPLPTGSIGHPYLQRSWWRLFWTRPCAKMQ